MQVWLSSPEMLLLEERCLDAEWRCERRAAEARGRGDYRAAAYELQLKEQYSNLRRKIMDRRDHGRRPLGISPQSSEAVRLRRPQSPGP